MSIKWIPEFGRRTSTGIDDFMRPEHLMTDEDRLVVKSVREFLEKEVMPHERELDDYWDWPLVKEKREFIDRIRKVLYIDFGIQKVLIPEEYGGLGMFRAVPGFLVREELARADLGLFVTAYMNQWGVTPVVGHGLSPKVNEEWMKEFAPKMTGDRIYQVSSLITEPHAGGSIEDALGTHGKFIGTTCKLKGGEWVINGHKLWASSFYEADLYRVICRVEDEEYPRNIRQVYVPADTPGVTKSNPYRKMGCNVDTNGDVWFEEVKVPKEWAAQEDPIDDLKSNVANAATLGRVQPEVIGVAKRAYELIREWAQTREINGRPMKDHGVLAHELGEIAQDIMTAEVWIYYMAERLDHPEVYGPPWYFKNMVAADACKKTANDAAFRAIDRALMLMGAHGYSKEMLIEKLFRDIKIAQIWVGGPMLYLTELSRYYFGTEEL